MAKPPKGINRLSVLAALVAGEAWSVYATFMAQILKAPSVYLVDRHGHRLPSGQIGYIEEVFNTDGLIFLLMLSLMVSISVWYGVQVIARYARGGLKLPSCSEVAACGPWVPLPGTAKSGAVVGASPTDAPYLRQSGSHRITSRKQRSMNREGRKRVIIL